MDATVIRKQDVVLSGGFGNSTNSARAGYLPVCLARVPLGALKDIPVYLRGTGNPARPVPDIAHPEEPAAKKEVFLLYCAESVEFTDRHRQRLTESGVKFVYIPMGKQALFREQTEAQLVELANDPSIAVSVKSEIIYETSVELMNELLSEPDLGSKSPRLEKVSRAVTTLVLNDPTAFSHLFATSHHDFYTATHMVNVATWMVPLAYALGHHDTETLNRICQAGLMHDIGKMFVSAEILNKKGRLSGDEWKQIQRHPELGCEHLAKYDRIDPLVHTVTMEHHERMDGTGYPHGIKGDQMHDVSKICAVVDSFDAMTAFRPFKERTMSVSEALNVIIAETPSKYDPKVTEAWMGLLRAAETQGVLPEPLDARTPGSNRRIHERFRINCPARLHVMDEREGTWSERPGVQTVAHNVSRSGLGILSQVPVLLGEHVRVYLLGNSSLSRVTEGVTVRCRAYKDQWYEVGMKSASLSEETAAALKVG